MTVQDRANIITNIGNLENKILGDNSIYSPNVKYDYDTARVMREETGLILNKQRTIFNILTVTTLVTVIITINI